MRFVAAVVRCAVARVPICAIALLALALSAPSAFALPRTRHVGPSQTNCDATDIQTAINTAASGDTILIDGSGTYGSQHLTIANKSLAIGAGPCQLVIGGKPDATQANAQVTLSGDLSATTAVITITGTGSVSLNDLKITGNTSSNEGGGIEHTSTGKLTLNNVLVTGNSGSNGGGVNVVGTADLAIGNDTQITGNIATLAGGGIRFASTGNLTAAGTGNLIGYNHAPNSFGGGLLIEGGAATITATGIGTLPLIYLNNAFSGGGIAVRGSFVHAGSLTLGEESGNAVVVDNNFASQYGGGIFTQPNADFGTVHSASVSAFNTRITQNGAFDGAALYVDCPNGAAICDGFSFIDIETDGCTGANCSTISGNTASSPNGAVIALKNASLLMADTRITGNTGARLINLSVTTFQSSETLIAGNTTAQDLMMLNGGLVQLVQSTLADNDVGASQLFNIPLGQFELSNSVIDSDVGVLKLTSGTQNVHNVVGTNIDGLSPANDVVLADPAFVDAAHGDYRLRVASDGHSMIVSPAVDFSNTQYDTADIDGRDRPKDVSGVTNRFGAFDLGAYEMQPISDRVFADGYGDLFLLAQ